MASTLEKLQKVLIEDEETQRKEQAGRAKRREDTSQLQRQIEEVLRSHGLLSPRTGSWIRPVPSSLYSSPLSLPKTTLMHWSSLPQSVRERFPKTSETNLNDTVVEVPLSLLQEIEEAGGGNSNNESLQRRPLGGNLTSKLTEYTRGAAGQCKPFHPGGMDFEDSNGHEDTTAEAQYMSSEEILAASQVLEKGSATSWRDGTIITSPPGADFEIGLGWNDLHSDDSFVKKGIDIADKAQFVVHQKIETSTETVDSPIQNQPLTNIGNMWDRSFFEDDSLFGDSDSDESDSEGSSESDEDILPIVESERDAGSPDVNDIVKHDIVDPLNGPADRSNVGDELDNLLADLSSAAASKSFEATKRSSTAISNPLQLAELHAQHRRQADRKNWADTKPLPIKDFHALIPNPAMTFPFELDGFQQQAVARLERSESIFVAAHTSAGKTVCAEYAVAMCKQHCTRMVYTSPIKALSNQKFRDFCSKFGPENVGLVTGDLQINVDDSTCLIMTTEILRSMLYRGADLIRDIEWCCFDEVHYVNDSERGVVWEEVIIMLPQYVNLMFLSATTPNTIEFSDWIGRTKRKPVHVIRTNYRPVPLSHFLWAGLKLHKIMEGSGGFQEKGYSSAARALVPSKEGPNSKGGSNQKQSAAFGRPRGGSKQLAWQAQGNKQNWTSLVKYLDREGLTPTVVFSFSKKKCEEIAYMLRSLDLNTGVEKSAAQAFALQTVARLSPSDSKLPQVLTICEMVKRGIGVHHGGLLPILKEMVEILFSRNLIKVLFATETFAMGINMPARAVVYNSIRKHDGTQFRVLMPGEYTQMSGRAGRRGLDKVGTVIMCCFGDEPPPQPILRNLLTGSSTRLQSQFRLTYNMILNLLRVEDMSVEDMIKRSFSEFATQRALTANDYPKLLARGERTLTKLEKEFAESKGSRIGAEDVEEYYNCCSTLLNMNCEILSYIYEHSGHTPLVPGRLVLVTSARAHGCVRAPALILRPLITGGAMKSSSRGPVGEGSGGKTAMVCLVLLPENFVPDEKEKESPSKPFSINYVGQARNRHYAIFEIRLEEIVVVSTSKHKIDGRIFLQGDESTVAQTDRALMDQFSGAVATGRKAKNEFEGMVPRGKSSQLGKEQIDRGSSLEHRKIKAVDESVSLLVDAERKECSEGLQSVNMKDAVKQGGEIIEYRRKCDEAVEMVDIVRSFSSHRYPNVEKYYIAVEQRETLRHKVKALKHVLSNESLQLFPDFLQRKSLLRTLGYVDENETVCVKGRVACEVNTCEELIVTEMVFEGVLNDLEPAEIVAALSSLVFQEKSNDDDFDSELPESLRQCCQRMKSITTKLGQMQKGHGLDIDPLEYCESSLKFGLVHVVYEWALGVPFSNICQLTLVQEGSIVRCITRLDELCREVRNCSRVVGNPTLYRKMEAASTAIKRDIVFASSLYVS